nr:phage portal protein [Gemmatimonadales bacterium]
VNGCVRAITETVAMLPLITYKRLENGGKRRAADISLYHVLHDTPNEQQSAYEFREMLTGHMLLRGNGYAEIVTDDRGAVAELLPLHPDRVEVESIRVAGKLRRRYKVTEAGGSPRTLLQDEMFHLRGLSFDGVVGISVIEYARETIELAQAQQQHGTALFRNGANPGGVLSHPGTLSEIAQKRLEKRFDRDYGGARRTGKTMVLEEGLRWEQIGLKSVDAEWLQSMRFGVSDIARFFRVPPHMIQDLDRATNNNIEEQGREFVTYTMMPHFRRWEGAIRRDLIIAPRTYFVEFNVDALLRGSTKDRLESYAIGRNIGLYSPNELRYLENMNPREDPGGDEYLSPLNMNSTQRDGAPPAPEPKPVPRPARPTSVPPQRTQPKRAALAPSATEALVAPAFSDRADAVAEAAERFKDDPAGLRAWLNIYEDARERRAPNQPPPSPAAELHPEAVAALARAERAATRSRRHARTLAESVLRREVQWGRREAIRQAASPQGWREAVSKFYRAHAAYVAEKLHITDSEARAYASANEAALAKGGVYVLETWERDHIEALTQLALDTERGDAP